MKLSHFWYKAIAIVTLVTLLLAPASRPQTASASPGVDWEITRLFPIPLSPVMGNAVTIEVQVTNIGTSPAPATTVLLSWCCGELTRDVPALAGGEDVSVKFEHALVVNEPRDYEITAKVDPGEAVAEDIESNNTKTDILSIPLREVEITPPPGAPIRWGDVTEQLLCPDNDLMKIGRVQPYVWEDVDGDGSPDRLSRTTERCEREDPPSTTGCQVFLPGQRDKACGTTCLAYVLRYFGREVWPDDIDAEIRSGDFEMFSEPIGLKGYAEAKRLNAEVYVSGDLDEVRALVQRGIPVMLDISNTAGSYDVMDGHWATVVSFCEVPADFPPGATRTVVGMYDPHGRQFQISPEDLYRFWGKIELGGITLWDRLYIAVSNLDLPSGNTDEVENKLALARAISMFMTGASDTFVEGFRDGDLWALIEDIVEMAGGLATGVGALLSQLATWGSDAPLVGGFLGAAGELGGEITIVAESLIESLASLLNPETWLDLERLGEVILAIFRAIGDAILAVLDFVWDIICAIGDFFVAIWEGLKWLGCEWFGVGCPTTVVYYKHYVSPDPCLETRSFISGFKRIEPIGYIYSSPVPDSTPVWLYTSTLSLEPMDYVEGDGLAVGDVNGDGKDEIVQGNSITHGDSRNKIRIYDGEGHKLNQFNGYFYPAEEIICGDVNGDGRDEIIEYSPHPATLKIYDMSGTSLGELRLRAWRLKGLETGDVNGDGKDEIIWADETSAHVLSMEGLTLASFNLVPEGVEDWGGGYPFYSFAGANGHLLGVGDIDGNGNNELILGVERGWGTGGIRQDYWLCSVDVNGNLLTRMECSRELFEGQLELGDIDANGKDEIIRHLDTYSGLDRPGYYVYIAGTSLELLGTIERDLRRGDKLLCGDLNGDGQDEIIHGDNWDGTHSFSLDRVRTDVTPPKLLGIWQRMGGLPEYLLHDDGDLALTDRNRINLGIVGYSLITGGVGSVNLADYAVTHSIGSGVSLGYLMNQPQPGAIILWLMQRLEDGAYTVATDPCDETQTFLGTIARGYTRELPLCFIPQSETPGARKLYRAYNKDTEDCLLSLEPDMSDTPRVGEYKRQGYIGYIYTDEQAGTVPLYQLFNRTRRDHVVTLYPDGEGLSGYGERQLLGYVLPITASAADLYTCNVPLWRFCKRVQKEE